VATLGVKTCREGRLALRGTAIYHGLPLRHPTPLVPVAVAPAASVTIALYWLATVSEQDQEV
jgi:hypothetical protein